MSKRPRYLTSTGIRLRNVAPPEGTVGITQTADGASVRTLHNLAGVRSVALGTRSRSRRRRRLAGQAPPGLVRGCPRAVQDQPVDGLPGSGIKFRRARFPDEHRRRGLRTGCPRISGAGTRAGGVVPTRPAPRRVRRRSRVSAGPCPRRIRRTRRTTRSPAWGLCRLGLAASGTSRGARHRGLRLRLRLPLRLRRPRVRRGRGTPGQQDRSHPEGRNHAGHDTIMIRTVSSTASSMSSRHTDQLR